MGVLGPRNPQIGLFLQSEGLILIYLTSDIWYLTSGSAGMAELVDASDLKSEGRKAVPVQVRLPAPRFAPRGYAWRSHS